MASDHCRPLARDTSHCSDKWPRFTLYHRLSEHNMERLSRAPASFLRVLSLQYLTLPCLLLFLATLPLRVVAAPQASGTEQKIHLLGPHEVGGRGCTACHPAHQPSAAANVGLRNGIWEQNTTLLSTRQADLETKEFHKRALPISLQLRPKSEACFCASAVMMAISHHRTCWPTILMSTDSLLGLRA